MQVVLLPVVDCTDPTHCLITQLNKHHVGDCFGMLGKVEILHFFLLILMVGITFLLLLSASAFLIL